MDASLLGQLAAFFGGGSAEESTSRGKGRPQGLIHTHRPRRAQGNALHPAVWTAGKRAKNKRRRLIAAGKWKR